MTTYVNNILTDKNRATKNKAKLALATKKICYYFRACGSFELAKDTKKAAKAVIKNLR